MDMRIEPVWHHRIPKSENVVCGPRVERHRGADIQPLWPQDTNWSWHIIWKWQIFSSQILRLGEYQWCPEASERRNGLQIWTLRLSKFRWLMYDLVISPNINGIVCYLKFSVFFVKCCLKSSQCTLINRIIKYFQDATKNCEESRLQTSSNFTTSVFIVFLHLSI